MPTGKEWVRKSEAVKGALLEDIMRSMPTWVHAYSQIQIP